MVDVAERAPLHDTLVRGSVDGVVVALVADLEHLVVPLRRVDHAAIAVARLGDHLLAQHVFAGIEACGDDVGVHPERRRGDDRLDGLVFEHRCVLDVVSRGRLSELLQNGIRRGKRVGPDVRHRHDFDEVRVDAAEERAALTADADEPDADAPALDRPLDHRRCAERGNRRHARDRPEKIPAPRRRLFGGEIHASISSVAPL